jgi:hypothetical protein
MPDVNLELNDAIELVELLTFLTDWLSGGQQQTLNDSLAVFVGHPGCNANNLAADLHRFVFCSDSATANNSSENTHHDRQPQSPTLRA